MRTLFPKILSGLLMVVFMRCDDEADQAASEQRVVIQFDLEQLALQEGNTEGTGVVLSLNHAATSTGTIRLMIDEDMQQRIQTTPAHVGGALTLAIAKGASQVQFSVKAVNNTVKEGDQTVIMSLEPSPGFILGDQKTLQLLIEEDDHGTNNPEPSVANLVSQQQTISENTEEAMTYRITLTPAVTEASQVIITIGSDNAAAFVTNPASLNNTITLQVPVGTTELSFTMVPINNTDFNGNTLVEFSMASTTGSVVTGTQVKQEITILDDELNGMLKGYELNGDGGEKRMYEYDSKGRIAKIKIESFAPHNPTTVTDTYFYDGQDRVVKINKWLGRDIIYSWNNNRIERADVYQDGVLIQYANYAYDEMGNVAGVEPFYKQHDGAFKRGLFTVYLYFTTGNIYKALTYNDSPMSEEPVLITTHTYGDYLDVSAPIAMLDILPNAQAQKNLAGSYRLEEHMAERDTQYYITYEFRPDGKPSKRIASAPGDMQTVVYHYY